MMHTYRTGGQKTKVGANYRNINSEIFCGKNSEKIKAWFEKAMRFFKFAIFKNGSG